MGSDFTVKKPSVNNPRMIQYHLYPIIPITRKTRQIKKIIRRETRLLLLNVQGHSPTKDSIQEDLNGLKCSMG